MNIEYLASVLAILLNSTTVYSIALHTFRPPAKTHHLLGSGQER